MSVPGSAPEHRLRFRETFAGGDLRVAAAEVPVSGDFVAHDHDFLEIALITAGQGVHRSIRGDQALGVGDVVILRPGAWHAYLQCRAMRVFNCCFQQEVLHRELAWTLEDPLPSHLLWSGALREQRSSGGVAVLHLDAPAQRACRARLARLSRSCANRGPEYRAQRVGLLLLFLGELARHVAKGMTSAVVPPVVHPAVNRAIRLFQTDLAREWSLSELASALMIDESYLGRRFKSATGLSPLTYLARLRAEQAATLLLRDETPIAIIGREVGWPDPNYFARRFRAHFGLSATDYRRRFAVRG